MSLKISANMSAVAHHIIDGAFTFPYAVDAHNAVSHFPAEWRSDPWSYEASSKAMVASGAEIEPLSAEEQAALDEYAAAVGAANERLKEFQEKKAAEKAEADQAVADERLVKSAPPVKRPFGRKGEPTAAELEMVRKKKTEDDLAAASRQGAPITG